MSWSWSFVPQRLMAEDAFLELSMSDRGLLYALYHRCDKWGRGPGSPRALATLVGCFEVRELAASLERLYASGLVVRSGADWQIDQYDRDAKSVGVMRRRNTPSEFGERDTEPEPEDEKHNDSKRQALPDVDGQRPSKTSTVQPSTGKGGQRPSKSASNETRRDETKSRRDDETEKQDARAGAPAPEDASAVGAPPEPPAGAGSRGAESEGHTNRDPGQPDPALWRPLPTPPAPTPAQARCMAMRWGGTRTPEHAEALMAWSRESGVPETRLRKWLAEQEEPLYFEPGVLLSKRREIGNARRFPPSVTQ